MKIEITHELLAELKEKAHDAAPGPWETYYRAFSYTGHGKGLCVRRTSEYNGSEKWIPYLTDICKMEIQKRSHPLRKVTKQEVTESNSITASYIAAANPAVMLALITKIEQLEKEADWLADKADESGECLDRNCPQRDQFLEHELYKEKCITCWRNAAKEAIKTNE